MFAIDTEHKFKRAVEVQKPIDAGFAKETLSVVFRSIGVDESQRLTKEGGDKGLLRKAVVDLPAVSIDGNQVPFSVELLEKVLDVPYVLTAMAKDYWRAINGAAEKN